MRRSVRNRRGMELAVNTLVVIILGIIIVGGGIALISTIYTKAVQLPTNMDKQTEQQLFSILLSSKQRIAVLENVQSASRKDMVTFPVAIQNQLEGVDATFKPVAAANASVAPDPLCMTSSPDPKKCPRMELLNASFTLKRYENKPFYVGIYIPASAKAGEYVYRVEVYNTTANGEIVGSTPPYASAKLHVNVR